MRRRHRRAGLTAMSAAVGAVVLAVAVTVGVLGSLTIGDLRDTSAAAQRAERAVAQANLVRRLLLELETGARGYVITHREESLLALREAHTAVTSALAWLDELVTDPSQRAMVQSIARDIRAYLSEYSEPLIQLAQLDGPAAAGYLVATRAAEAQLETLRRKFAAFDAAERRIVTARDRTAGQEADLATAVAIGGMALTALLVALVAVYVGLRIGRPVGRIASAARRLAAGDLFVRVPQTGSGEVADLVGAFNEMAERLERTRVELAAERSAFEAVVASSPLAIVTYDPGGRVTTWNAAAATILGWSKDEIVGTVPTFVPEHTALAAREAWQRALAGESAVSADLALVRRDGSPVEVRSWSCALPGPDGRLAGVISLFEDMGERLHAEREVTRIFDLCTDLVCVFGVDGFFRRVNPAFERTLGFSAETLLATRALDFVHPEDGDRALAVLQGLGQGEAVHGFEVRLRCADGSYRWLNWDCVPVLAEGVAYAIAHDVTESKRLHGELAASRDEALRATQAKSVFLSRMSHELRTPLNAILGFGQLLELEEAGGPQGKESVEQILKAGRHLLELINEVLDISRIEAGQMPLSLEPVEVATAIVEATALMRPVAAERGVSLLSEHAAVGRVHVVADRQRLMQILLNLLSNAIKYSPVGGTVVIGGEYASPGRIRLFVGDSGPGIPPELLERLFVPFDRLGEADSAISGTGLGLALSKGLAEAMGGVAGVDSTPGEGATFWVELGQAEDPVERCREQALESTSPRIVSGSTRQLTILCVEDNLSNLRLIERILGDRPDVRLLSAMQGRLGLELAREHAPDVILLDLHLPDIPGREVLRRLRQQPQTASVPVVVLSADATPGQIKRLLAEGATAYLTKPIDVKEFIAMLARLLGAAGGEEGPE